MRRGPWGGYVPELAIAIVVLGLVLAVATCCSGCEGARPAKPAVCAAARLTCAVVERALCAETSGGETTP